MLDMAPNQHGLVNPDQVERYAEFGEWIRTCYDTSIASASFASPSSSSTSSSSLSSSLRIDVNGADTSSTLRNDDDGVVLEIPAGSGPFDRVVVRENQTAGQLIRAYVIEASATGTTGPWDTIATGTSMGNKWIHFLPNASGMTASAVRVRVTESAAGHTGQVRRADQEKSGPVACDVFDLLLRTLQLGIACLHHLF